AFEGHLPETSLTRAPTHCAHLSRPRRARVRASNAASREGRAPLASGRDGCPQTVACWGLGGEAARAARELSRGAGEGRHPKPQPCRGKARAAVTARVLQCHAHEVAS